MEALVAVRERDGGFETSTVVIVCFVGRPYGVTIQFTRISDFFFTVCNASPQVRQCDDDCDLCPWRLCASHACLETDVSARRGDLTSLSYESERAQE